MGLAGVTKGRWSGWRLAATVVAFSFRRGYHPQGVTSSPFLKQWKARKQQEYPEDAVMLN
ncbi:hypothetical protein [Bacteroides caccae]|uniref:hypothetical protein n=1 Tax=Bacteroides caccae TaxID=47678 RepID=UPI000E9690A6|nr:hypothetical protein [Bacteroides caccae]RGD80396.1 hypothetical protein DW706_09220 [Bacteroides caccae]